MTDSDTQPLMPCRCEEVERLDGEEAEAYASKHLTLIERGRGNYEMYACIPTGSSWIMDFPLRDWAADRRGRVRLRREPWDYAALPIGALDLGAHAEPIGVLADGIQEKVAAMPEFHAGVHRVTVELADGRVFPGVEIAWSSEIIRVPPYAEVPFDAADVVDVLPSPD